MSGLAKAARFSAAIVFLAAIWMPLRQDQDWKTFHSSLGFSVSYPATWFLFGESTATLYVRTSPVGATAVMIQPGQAVIAVAEETKYKDSSLESMVDVFSQGMTVSSRSQRVNARAGPGQCQEFTQIVGEAPIIDPEAATADVPVVGIVVLACEVGGHKYATVVRNFRGDPKQDSYRRIALEMAESLTAKR